MSDRENFLINMYNQLFNDINRHITLTWQAIGIIGGSVAILALIEKKVITVELAVILIVFLCFWGINILIDSAYWYRRNQVMIANIERQFLLEKDLEEIFHYFGEHPKFSFIGHLKVQFWLICGILITFLCFNASKSVSPFLNIPNILTVVLSLFTTFIFYLNKEKYQTFMKHSPGKEIKPLVIKKGKIETFLDKHKIKFI